MKDYSISLVFFGHVVKICLRTSRFKDRQAQFRTYIEDNYAAYKTSQSVADTIITIEDGGESIVFIKKKHEYFAKTIVEEKTGYTTYYFADEAIINIIIRMIVSKVLKTQGLMLHASSIIHKNKALLFSAVSGTGKSTLAQNLGENYQLFTDDLVCLIKDEQSKSFHAYQIPVPEKNYIPKMTKGYPIAGIFFLTRDKKPIIQKLDNTADTYNLLLDQLWAEEKYMKSNLRMLQLFYKQHKVYNRFVLGRIYQNKKYFIEYLISHDANY